MFEDVHCYEGFDDTVEISNKCYIEIVELDLTESGNFFVAAEAHIDVVFQTERNEKSRKNDVSETNHRLDNLKFAVEVRED